jgi:aminopeptidase N
MTGWARGRTAAMIAVLVALVSGCTTQAAAPHIPLPSSPLPAHPAPAEPGVSQPQADPLYPAYGNPNLDVLSYRLQLGYVPTTTVLTGTATLLIRAVTDLTSLSLDFDNSYTVDGATVDDAAEVAHRSGHDLVVPIGRTLPRDGRTTLVVRYHGTPHQIPFPSERSDAAEGLGLRAMPDGEAWTMQEPYGASTWYPVNDHPSDEALYDISVTVPSGWTAVASGTPGAVTSSAAGVTYRYTSTDPVASYVTTLAIGHYTKVTDTGPGGVPLTYWIRTGRDEAFLPAVRDMPALLRWLTDHFGPYPFPTCGVVVVDSGSAMETQQMITLGGKLSDSDSVDVPNTEEELLHELSHQWFGDSVTPTNWLGLWLNEGWAMYAEWMWSVDQGIESDADWLSFAREDDAKSRRTAGPPGHPLAGHFAEDNVYLGPAMMLRQIRKAVGDKQFFALATDWVQTQRDTSVDRAEFIAFVNHHTGRDFTALINTWLDSPTEPAES